MSFKILMVGSPSDFVREGREKFQEIGWQTAHAASGLSAIEKVQTFEPDLVVVCHDIDQNKPFPVIKNMAAVPKRRFFQIILVGTEDFYQFISKEGDKWNPFVHYFAFLPKDIREFVRFCNDLSQGTEKLILQKKYRNLFYLFTADRKTEILHKESEPLGKEIKSISSKNEDIKTLKHYIAMKDLELKEIQDDLKRAREQLQIFEKKSSDIEYEHAKVVNQQKELYRKIEILTRENEERRNQYERELKSREQESRTKSEKILLLEQKVEIAQKKYDELKERIKHDIQRIQVREKELEAKLEILKRDSETLLTTKDRKLLEYKRKIDALEYEIESFAEKEKVAQKKIEFWKNKIDRVLRALKLATSLLESDETVELEKVGKEEETETTMPKKSPKAA